MNLFQAAGLDLPSSGSGKGHSPQFAPRIPLFAPKILEGAIGAGERNPDPDRIKAATAFAKRARSAGFLKQKETAIRQLFYEEILGRLLGYRQYREDGQYDVAFERPLRRKSVDVALGRFFAENEKDEVLAPFEMKGPDTFDLDRIIPGRGFSPVQQAWDYAADVPGANWVLVSNCLEIRLYAFGRGRETYERFDLTRIDETDELARLLLILRRDRLLEGGTAALLEKSDGATKEITDQLYKEYAELRGKLIAYLADSADGPKFGRLPAIETAQKLLDRVIFIAFASGNGMLPQHIFRRAIEHKSGFKPAPVWTNVNTLFGWIDKGNDVPSEGGFRVWPYNGGLFAHDPLADNIVLPDWLAEVMVGLVEWDYGREISVTVLGHIFEQSIGDIEKLREGEVVTQAVSQRKREGVVYTPDHVTRFLVEKTIGASLAERFAALLKQRSGAEAWPEDDRSPFASDMAQSAFWLAYLEAMRALTVVDPACGSGAFLVAAFDYLAAEYARVLGLLDYLGEAPKLDIAEEILTRNLHGVDLNVESAEITRLALWLKTARREHRLAKLDQTIRAGNSLIDDRAATERPFDWNEAFPEIMAAGGFDIVIGNPPYVRMETIKPIKPWLAKHYTVADERTDLYAYFFEKGVRLLKEGGRLGYISSSTFFRTGSGERLRLLLNEYTDIETVTDFGDAQIFEGVTTYPAILTARKRRPIGPPQGDLRFYNIKGEPPRDLARAFSEKAQAMPRARLTGGSWQFEDDALARLREKIVKGKKTLGEVYGAPMRGIVTGLNEAFVIDTPTRDRLVKADPKSADLLKPFLKGENIKRWRVEPEGLWLINTPKGKIDINHYPAIRDWLLPFKEKLEARATQQEWWELQQAQLAYQPKFDEPKTLYPELSQGPKFAHDADGYFIINKGFFINSDESLAAYLNSKSAWFICFGIASPLRGGQWRLELREQYVSTVALPEALTGDRRRLLNIGKRCCEKVRMRTVVVQSFANRILSDLANPGSKLSRRLASFHELDFSAFRTEVKRAIKVDIPLKQRGEWQEFHAEKSAEVKRLTAEIEAAEREIDRLVYEAFDLTSEEIGLLEKSLEGQV